MFPRLKMSFSNFSVPISSLYYMYRHTLYTFNDV